MKEIRVTQVTLKSEGDCRGTYLKEYMVNYTVGGKGFTVQVFHDSQEGWYTVTAHLDNAVAEFAGMNYFQLSAEARRKIRKEIADKIVRLTKHLL